MSYHGDLPQWGRRLPVIKRRELPSVAVEIHRHARHWRRDQPDASCGGRRVTDGVQHRSERFPRRCGGPRAIGRFPTDTGELRVMPNRFPVPARDRNVPLSRWDAAVATRAKAIKRRKITGRISRSRVLRSPATATSRGGRRGISSMRFCSRAHSMHPGPRSADPAPVRRVKIGKGLASGRESRLRILVLEVGDHVSGWARWSGPTIIAREDRQQRFRKPPEGAYSSQATTTWTIRGLAFSAGP